MFVLSCCGLCCVVLLCSVVGLLCDAVAWCVVLLFVVWVCLLCFVLGGCVIDCSVGVFCLFGCGMWCFVLACFVLLGAL